MGQPAGASEPGSKGAGEPVLQGAAPDPEGARKQAAAAVESAVRAFAAGDYERALAHFERAMALRPSPKIHYNIGVCHQQLMLAARARGDATAEAGQAAAAVEAFKAYLRDAPNAEDRLEVEAAIRDLGGAPVTHGRLKPIPPPRTHPVQPDVDAPEDTGASPPPPVAEAAAAAAPFPPPPVAEAPAGGGHVVANEGQLRADQDQPTPPHAPEFRGRVGFGPGLLGQPQIGTTRLDGAIQGAVTGRFGGFVGARRRAYLGIAGLLAGAGETAKDKLALHTQALLFDVEYAHPLGRAHRLELMVGGLLVGAREALRTRTGTQRPTCAADSTGTLVGQRGGGGAGGRLGLHVLLGARKNHEIGVRLSTAILGFGKGTAAAGCEPRPFVELDVPRARWILLVDTGYSFRF